jgi:hypothetical protein
VFCFFWSNPPAQEEAKALLLRKRCIYRKFRWVRFKGNLIGVPHVSNVGNCMLYNFGMKVSCEKKANKKPRIHNPPNQTMANN